MGGRQLIDLNVVGPFLRRRVRRNVGNPFTVEGRDVFQHPVIGVVQPFNGAAEIGQRGAKRIQCFFLRRHRCCFGLQLILDRHDVVGRQRLGQRRRVNAAEICHSSCLLSHLLLNHA
ncbi:hypothetical protein D3C85_1378680 [compost metagenome]